MSQTFAIVYGVLACLPIAVQLALASGAPWGSLTLGGKWPDRLPRSIRVVAAVQALLLLGMALAVLSKGGAIGLALPNWSYYAAMGLTVFTLISNSITPSKPERKLWVPVIAGMLIAGFLVGQS